MAAVIAAAALLSACEPLAMEPLPPSLLAASVAGSIELSYEGNAVFSTLQRGPVGFILDSSRLNGGTEGFQFMAPHAPGPGSHPLSSAGDAIRATFLVPNGSRTLRYTAADGELIVDAATPTRIQGSFRLSGRLTAECTHGNGWVRCDPVADDGAVIEVDGVIDAVADPRRVFLR